ncbi:MAG: ABC transporter ATP-binding protein, partial [Bacteroidota bacterium]
MEKEQNISGSIVDLGILKRLFVFAKPYMRYFYVLVFLTISLALLVPARPLLIQLTIDNDIAQGDLPGLVNMILILIGLLFVQSVVQYYHTYLSGWLGQY